MKPGTRALGIAESYQEARSTLAGAVVRGSRVVDGLAFESCTVGGTDATAAVEALWRSLDRPDVRYLLVAGIAPAWYNVLDIVRLSESVDRPVLSVSFESSPGLESAIDAEFDGRARQRRLATYRAQPERRRLEVGDETLFVRSVGIDDDAAADVVRSFTPTGGRPEPVRVARLAARAGDAFRRSGGAAGDPDSDTSGTAE